MKLTSNAFVISDTHFEHKKIIEFEARPPEHNEIMVKRWNATVSPSDLVLFLGDLSFCNQERTKFYTDRLQGVKWMIRGNHDNHSESWYNQCGFKVIEPAYKWKFYKGFNVMFTHEPVIDLPEKWYNIHGHIHLGRHREFPLTPRHLNMSVEAIDYTPQRISTLLDAAT